MSEQPTTPQAVAQLDANGKPVNTQQQFGAPIQAPVIGERNHAFKKGMRTSADVQGQRAVPQY